MSVRLLENGATGPPSKKAKLEPHPFDSLVVDVFNDIFKTFDHRELLLFEQTSKKAIQFTHVRWKSLNADYSQDFQLTCLEGHTYKEKWQYITKKIVWEKIESRNVWQSYQRLKGIMLKIPPLGAAIWSYLKAHSFSFRSIHHKQFEKYTFEKTGAKSGDLALEALAKRSPELLSLALQAGAKGVSKLASKIFPKDNFALALARQEIAKGDYSGYLTPETALQMYIAGARSSLILTTVYSLQSIQQRDQLIDELLTCDDLSFYYLKKLVDEALSQYQKGNLSRAEALYDKCLSKANDNTLIARICFEAHGVQLQLLQWEKAETFYRKAAQLSAENSWQIVRSTYQMVVDQENPPLWVLTNSLKYLEHNNTVVLQGANLASQLMASESEGSCQEVVKFLKKVIPKSLPTDKKTQELIWALYYKVVEKGHDTDNLYLKVAVFFYRTEDFYKADSLLNEAIALSGNNVSQKVYSYALGCKLMLGAWEEAKALRNKIIWDNTDYSFIAAMDDIYEEVEAFHKENIPHWFALCTIRLRLARADHDLDKLCEEILVQLEKALTSTSDYDEVCQGAIDLCWSMDENYTINNIMLNVSHFFDLESWQGLEACFSRLLPFLKNPPADFYAYFAFVHLHLDQLEQANSLFEKAVTLYGDKVPPKVAQRFFLVKCNLNQWENADNYYKEVASKYPWTLELQALYFNLGRVKLAFGQWEDSERFYGKYLKQRIHERRPSQLWIDLPHVKCKLKKHNQAEECLSSVIYQEDALQLEDWPKASILYEEILAHYDDWIPGEVYINAAHVNFKAGNLERAKIYYNKARTVLQEGFALLLESKNTHSPKFIENLRKLVQTFGR